MTTDVLTYAQQLAQFRALGNSYLFELTQEQIERAFSTHPSARENKEATHVLFDPIG